MKFLKKNYGWFVLVIIVVFVFIGIHDSNIQKYSESFSLLKEPKGNSDYYYGATQKLMTLMLHEISHFVSMSSEDLKREMQRDIEKYGVNGSMTEPCQIPKIPGTSLGRCGILLFDFKNQTITEIVDTNPVKYRNCGSLLGETVLSVSQLNWEGEFYNKGNSPSVDQIVDPQRQKEKDRNLDDKWLF